MGRTKEENKRRKTGGYADFRPDGDPVGVGGLSFAHARMTVAFGSSDAVQRSDTGAAHAYRLRSGADRMRR
jgi:hypothetical protein